MIFTQRKYLPCCIRKPLLGVPIFLLLSITTSAQNTTVKKDSSNTYNNLSFYHSFTSAKTTTRPYTHINYTRPNNQLMSWPNFPLTPTEFERRRRQYVQENKPSSVIAKDIITNILKKKTKVAVVPKF
ncbi:hypothetical protein [Ferruginibacter sp. SUN106]|uniref:hypothetical protein n=1 Tax=Ferruginibacter sp. SUN106 TaxID=2978348 RepID=UPI003D36F7AD